MDIRTFKKLPIMGILRGIDQESIEPIAQMAYNSGLRAVEIAMNSKNSPRLIKRLRAICKGKLMVGAGTVLNMDCLKSALDNGATYIVLPTIVTAVIKHCVKKNIPVFPGAFTPNEILEAWDSGASMVKLFPAKCFGPGYLKEIKAPFNHIEIMACGGVNSKNIKEFFANGASAVAFGSSIFNNELIAAGKYSQIGLKIKKLINAFYGCQFSVINA